MDNENLTWQFIWNSLIYKIHLTNVIYLQCIIQTQWFNNDFYLKLKEIKVKNNNDDDDFTSIVRRPSLPRKPIPKTTYQTILSFFNLN